MDLKEVFEPIVNFMKSFQKKEKDISKQAAKDRLKLVLMQDRASVSPDFFEMMKKEIIDVIKKYIEIDEESLEVQLTRGYEAGLEGPALYANIPIKHIKPVASKNEENDISNKEVDRITDAIADEILEEAQKKVQEVSEVKVRIEDSPEKVVEDELDKNVESIAQNVAKEMKKTTAKASTKSTARTTKSTKKTTTGTKKTTKKATTTE